MGVLFVVLSWGVGGEGKGLNSAEENGICALSCSYY